MSEYLAQAEKLGRPPHAILIDSCVAGQPGGTGATVGEDVLDSMPPLPRLILAGGLTPANVAAKVERFRPWMVDVASGVESAPGRKDPALIAAFVRAAKSALVAVAALRLKSAPNLSGSHPQHEIVDKPWRAL